MALGQRLAAGDPIILARGKGVSVTQAQLDEAFVNLRATLAAQGRGIAEAQRATIERQLVEKLALTQLLMARATEADRKKAEEKVVRLIAEQKEKAETQARFDAQVRAAGLNPATFEAQLRERAICEEVLERELAFQLGITPEKVRSYYDQNPGPFRQPERVRLQQIVLSTRHASGAPLNDVDKAEKRHLAERLLERLRKGEDIGALAREFSDDPTGRDRNGEYLFPIGRIVPELEVVVVSMPTNKISDIITTPYGFHLVKVLERLPGELVPFDTVSDRIRSRLELEATQNALPDYQQKLFEEAGVEFLLPEP
jgi:parvulin-like peptidyl-prolyl isomerase